MSEYIDIRPSDTILEMKRVLKADGKIIILEILEFCLNLSQLHKG
jgi:ubiquinone/menaquinone biosynthesis C-methylase UbiE